MNIEEFRDIYVIKDGEWKALNEWMQKYDREVKPIWRNWHQSAGVQVIK